MTGLAPVALVGLEDPIRDSARDAVRACRRAGISVKILTGDHAGTAQRVADELELSGGAMSGTELRALDDNAIRARARDTSVFSRLEPRDKDRLRAPAARRG